MTHGDRPLHSAFGPLTNGHQTPWRPRGRGVSWRRFPRALFGWERAGRLWFCSPEGSWSAEAMTCCSDWPAFGYSVTGSFCGARRGGGQLVFQTEVTAIHGRSQQARLSLFSQKPLLKSTPHSALSGNEIQAALSSNTAPVRAPMGYKHFKSPPLTGSCSGVSTA